MIRLKTIVVTTALGLVVLGGCKNTVQKKGKGKFENQTDKEQSANIYGNYVSDGYVNRNEGYDWVAVSIKQAGENKISLSVRSRADKKNPTCTFDAIFFKQNDNLYQTRVDGKEVLLTIQNQSIKLNTKDPADSGVLFFYCSGGASLAGEYTKIDGELDRSQIDKTLFSKFLELQGVAFRISSVQNDSCRMLSIVPLGLELDNSVENIEIDGRVIDAEIEDLNSDGSPEVLIYTCSDGSGSYGDVIAYSVNNKKSMSRIYFEPVAQNTKIKLGYMGHDEFALVERSLVQRFPIYKDGDSNANPTGGMRQIAYELVDGEACRRFVVKQMSEYK
ncbi:PliI/PliC-like inhibitor of I-type lysozyme [Ancylomarina subtilis]|uniref:PliI/PliC-like inhibitor of I-type lysozyme n=1 Tax=Ancylomarina subtilis TaxID=1639035 RepID=A0A4Q7VJJ9_9BACT|nr:PliI family lysozyme inhibitor of I-type lysozyme [Ancylomarina subtilis]RZT96380.1 PliI/PliC-like inhibitor of I-type lysozyme [Ancylomarina subtilis]